MALVFAAALIGVTGSSAGTAGAPHSAPVLSAHAAPLQPPLSVPYHSKDGYSLTPPSGWYPRPDVKAASMAFVAPAADPASKVGFKDNVSVVVSHGFDSLGDVVATGRRELEANEGFVLVDDRADALRDGRPVHVFIGMYRLQRVDTVRFTQMVVFDRGKSFVVTFTVLEPSFSANRDLMKAVVNSFTLD